MRNCAICADSNVMCSKCEIKDLKKQLYDACEIIRTMKDESHLVLTEDYQIHKHKLEYKLTQSLKEIPFPYKDTHYFLTITFDPDFTGHSNQEEHEKVYILTKLLEADAIFDEFYGCFEKQSNGRIHAHILVNTYDPYELKKFLVTKFTTKNMKTQRAIQIDKATPTALDYINKTQNRYGEPELKFGFFRFPKIAAQKALSKCNSMPEVECTAIDGNCDCCICFKI